jgi:hypothetical protein
MMLLKATVENCVLGSATDATSELERRIDSELATGDFLGNQTRGADERCRSRPFVTPEWHNLAIDIRLMLGGSAWMS